MPANGQLATVDGRRKLGGPACPFDINRWNSRPESYTSTAGGRTVWGQTCPPDYDILQSKDVGGAGYFGNTMQLAEDPLTRTIVGVDTWDTGNVIAIRHAGTGRNKTFTIGNPVDTGRNLLPRQGPPEQRPPAFDKTGRMWVTFHIWPPSPGFTQPIDHWVGSVDIAQLFAPVPIGLSGTIDGQTRVQAEQTTTAGTSRRPVQPDGVIPIDSTAYMLRCTGACANDGVPGDGFMLRAGAVEYAVWAPSAGTHQISHQVRGAANQDNPNPAIRLTVGANSQTTSVNTGDAWRTVTGPTVQLAKGVNNLRLAPPADGGNWYLNWLTLKHLGPGA